MEEHDYGKTVAVTPKGFKQRNADMLEFLMGLYEHETITEKAKDGKMVTHIDFDTGYILKDILFPLKLSREYETEDIQDLPEHEITLSYDVEDDFFYTYGFVLSYYVLSLATRKFRSSGENTKNPGWKNFPDDEGIKTLIFMENSVNRLTSYRGHKVLFIDAEALYKAIYTHNIITDNKIPSNNPNDYYALIDIETDELLLASETNRSIIELFLQKGWWPER